MANLGKQISEIQKDVLNVNIVLEAFGNAKTVYNKNSSRFVRKFNFLFKKKKDKSFWFQSKIKLNQG